MKRLDAIFLAVFGMCLFMSSYIAIQMMSEIKALRSHVFAQEEFCIEMRNELHAMKDKISPFLADAENDRQFEANARRRERLEQLERAAAGKDGGIGYYEPLGNSVVVPIEDLPIEDLPIEEPPFKD